MSDTLQRWLISAMFTGMAVGLLYLGAPICAMFPAAAGAYIAGSLLYEVWKEGKQ